MGRRECLWMKLELQEPKERRTSQKLIFFVQSGWGAGSCYWIRRLTEKSTTQEIRLSLLKNVRTTRQLTSSKNKLRTRQSALTSHLAKHQFSNSFFVKTLIDWNHLEDSVVWATSVESFKSTVSQTVNKWTVLSLPLDISKHWLLQRSSLSLANPKKVILHIRIMKGFFLITLYKWNEINIMFNNL